MEGKNVRIDIVHKNINQMNNGESQNSSLLFCIDKKGQFQKRNASSLATPKCNGPLFRAILTSFPTLVIRGSIYAPFVLFNWLHYALVNGR